MPLLARIAADASARGARHARHRRRALLFVLLAGAAVACSPPSIGGLDEDARLPERREAVTPREAGAASSDPPGEAPPSRDEPRQGNDDAGAPAEDAAPPPPPPPPPPPVGNWFQANGQDCVAFCAGRGATNTASPDGARCTSGENIPQSALAAGITYDECFPNCGAHVSGNNPHSVGDNCYADGQTDDGDSSDVTRGCFCL